MLGSESEAPVLENRLNVDWNQVFQITSSKFGVQL